LVLKTSAPGDSVNCPGGVTQEVYAPMHEKPIGGDPAAQEKQTQRLLLSLVVNQQQRPWSIEEVLRAFDGLSSTLDIEDALAQLRTVGLINRTGELVFASQTAVHIEYLGMLTI